MVGTKKEKDNVPASTNNILDDAKRITEDSRLSAYRAVNTAMIQHNWLLDKRIAEVDKLEFFGLSRGVESSGFDSKRCTDLYLQRTP
jgi:hypothetical protein